MRTWMVTYPQSREDDELGFGQRVVETDPFDVQYRWFFWVGATPWRTISYPRLGYQLFVVWAAAGAVVLLFPKRES